MHKQSIAACSSANAFLTAPPPFHHGGGYAQRCLTCSKKPDTLSYKRFVTMHTYISSILVCCNISLYVLSFTPLVSCKAISAAIFLAPNSRKQEASIHSIDRDMADVAKQNCSRSLTKSSVDEDSQPEAASSPASHHTSLSTETPQNGDDDGSLRKKHSSKRAEEPPRNEDGKMVCKYQKCSNLSFDRKCEWR